MQDTPFNTYVRAACPGGIEISRPDSPLYGGHQTEVGSQVCFFLICQRKGFWPWAAVRVDTLISEYVLQPEDSVLAPLAVEGFVQYAG
jgi:hypothetical protein